jgi:hypothetical protein
LPPNINFWTARFTTKGMPMAYLRKKKKRKKEEEEDEYHMR